MLRVRRVAQHLLFSASAQDAATQSEVVTEYPVDPDEELIYKDFDIPPRRLQAEWRAEWISERVNGILPGLMDESEVEFWVVSQKEYDEDTVWRALTPATQQAARRRSVIVFKRTPEGVEQQIFVGFWQETWDEVKEFLCSGNGGDIAVNRSKAFAFADGMASGEFMAFEEGVGEEVMQRVKHPELLPIYFLMIRAPSMLPHYSDACELSHSVMCEAMSNRVIVPGETTCADVSWWMWQRSIDLGFECWFQPSFGVQRAGSQGTLSGDVVIERGDFLWTDCEWLCTLISLFISQRHSHETVTFLLLRRAVSCRCDRRDRLRRDDDRPAAHGLRLPPGGERPAAGKPQLRAAPACQLRACVVACVIQSLSSGGGGLLPPLFSLPLSICLA
jgi:hypothetical protein